MIRIDEIYNHTFWPWLEKNRPGTRLFFCDPPGSTDPASLFNLGSDTVVETDFVFCHDQEPADMDLFRPLFDHAVEQGRQGLGYFPIDGKWQHMVEIPENTGHVIVSERGENIKRIEQEYGVTTHYYFYHGWACMDWFRGYDKTFLIPRARDRRPTKVFMSPNRIVAGKRDHRVLFLYNVFKLGLDNNHISAPRICPYENVDITSIAQKYTNVYHDITNVFEQASLPRTFAGETDQEMHSYRLGNWAEAADSLIYVPTETVYFGQRTHLTEKTFKAIALEMPFILVAPAHSLKYLREYGFKTFDGIFDESYDTIEDDVKRIEAVAGVLADIQTLDPAERQRLFEQCLPIVEHNYDHFYNGGFTQILWQELQDMLNGI